MWQICNIHQEHLIFLLTESGMGIALAIRKIESAIHSGNSPSIVYTLASNPIR